MSCDNCDRETNRGTTAYPLRVGNSKIGYGTVLIFGCRDHAQLLLDYANLANDIQTMIRQMEPKESKEDQDGTPEV